MGGPAQAGPGVASSDTRNNETGGPAHVGPGVASSDTRNNEMGGPAQAGPPVSVGGARGGVAGDTGRPSPSPSWGCPSWDPAFVRNPMTATSISSSGWNRKTAWPSGAMWPGALLHRVEWKTRSPGRMQRSRKGRPHPGDPFAPAKKAIRGFLRASAHTTS